jgi:transcriptional repressor NrdR
MRCPFCNHPEDKVIDSRESKEGESIRRRRECEKCTRRFTTYERIDEIPYMVVKKDGRREKFDRQKVMQGLVRASEKRPISMSKLAGIIDDVETRLSETPDRELSTVEIGELIMENLKALDKIAYVRFASVYRDFQDVDAFLREVSDLTKHKRT